jgi:hypothetical protein
MKSVGLTVAREDCYSLGDLQTIVNTVIPGSPGITIMPVLIPSPSATAAETYSACYTLGAQAAQLLAGVVPVIEFGNEYDYVCILSANADSDGNAPSDYSQTLTPLYQAILAGLANGWRSVDTTKKTLLAGPAGAYIHWGWLKMLLDGTLPNGASSGYSWTPDIVTWHFYDGGGATLTQIDGLTGQYNMLNSLSSLFSGPILFSEFGSENTDSASTAEAMIKSQLPNLTGDSNVAGFMWYELLTDQAASDGDFGLFTPNGSTNTPKAWVSTLTNFVAANPKS